MNWNLGCLCANSICIFVSRWAFSHFPFIWYLIPTYSVLNLSHFVSIIGTMSILSYEFWWWASINNLSHFVSIIGTMSILSYEFWWWASINMDAQQYPPWSNSLFWKMTEFFLMFKKEFRRNIPENSCFWI